MFVWVITKSNGEFFRNVAGLPLYFVSRREAEQVARKLGFKDFTIVRIKD